MLVYTCFKQELLGGKQIVSFKTYEGNRVDISKKFIKYDNIANCYKFSKEGRTEIIKLDTVYVVEVSKINIADKLAIGIAQDFLDFNIVIQYKDFLDMAKKLNKSSW